jgi:hypothetical protein
MGQRQKSKPSKMKYKLIVQIGKKPIATGLKKRVYRFTTDDPAKALNTISIPKMMEECFFTLEIDGKVAKKQINAVQARRIFNNKLNAFYFIKQMKWILK